MDQEPGFEAQEASKAAEVVDVAVDGPRLLRGNVLLRIAAVALIALIALVFAADYATSSPRLCGSCHEMGPATESWHLSAHSQIKCVKCHQAPHPWYNAPAALVGRVALFERDMGAHILGASAKSVSERATKSPDVTDEVCLQCHDADRKATSGFRIQIKHAEHAKRNKSCISCHLKTAHPEATKGRALSLMAQCYTCHGNKEKPKASTRCGLCHPKGFDLKPASHKKASWQREHSLVARHDGSQCKLCHEPSFCRNCHGLEMPHPKGWASDENGHPAYAKRDRAVCVRCHKEKPDMCTMCHHKGYDAKLGTWRDQHFLEVKDKGAFFCIDCHGPLYCVRCHIKGGKD